MLGCKLILQCRSSTRFDTSPTRRRSNLRRAAVVFGAPYFLYLFKDFVARARVLKLYRQALRITRRAPDHARAELRVFIRQEMENNRNCNDRQRIRFLISEGLERLKGLDETLDMQGHS